MTVIESFALNIPVIAPNHSGFKDLITHSKTGYLIDFYNHDEAKNELLEIDKKPINSLKANVKLFYDSNLSEEVHLNKILEIYQNLLAN